MSECIRQEWIELTLRSNFIEFANLHRKFSDIERKIPIVAPITFSYMDDPAVVPKATHIEKIKKLFREKGLQLDGVKFILNEQAIQKLQQAADDKKFIRELATCVQKFN